MGNEAHGYDTYLIQVPDGVDSMSLSKGPDGSMMGTAMAGDQQIPFNNQSIIDPPSQTIGGFQNAVMEDNGTITMTDASNPIMSAPSGVVAGMTTGMANTNEEPTMGKTDDKSSSSKNSSSSEKSSSSKSDDKKKKKNGTASIMFAGILGATLC